MHREPRGAEGTALPGAAPERDAFDAGEPLGATGGSGSGVESVTGTGGVFGAEGPSKAEAVGSGVSEGFEAAGEVAPADAGRAGRGSSAPGQFPESGVVGASESGDGAEESWAAAEVMSVRAEESVTETEGSSDAGQPLESAAGRPALGEGPRRVAASEGAGESADLGAGRSEGAEDVVGGEVGETASEGAEGAVSGPGRADDGDDFELARPQEGDGDYELSEPERPVVSLAKGDVASAVPETDAAPTPDAPASPVQETGPAPRPGAPETLVPETALDAAPGAPASFVPDASLGGVPDASASLVPEPPFDTPTRPLHRSDEYSTPPYGQPGPWADAPPVQHPGVVRGEPWGRYDPWAAPLQQTGEGVRSEKERKRERWKGVLAGAVLLALVAGGVGGYVGVQLERNGIGGIQLPQAPPEPSGRAADSIAGIAARALPSVVTLHVKGSGESGTGTGFVLDDRGYILTNNHVVQPAGGGGEITVVFNGGQAVPGEIVGRDAGYDLAVVKVKGVRNLTPLTLGNSDGVQVGDQVVAIGAPFDLSGTVTSGIISAKERPITAGGDGSDVSYVDALQTDAPINPGNSGGPLLDARGRVIGINSAIRSASGTEAGTGQAGSVGLGFAIPVNQGKRIAEELIAKGRATHPIIGITLDLSYTGQGARVRTDSGEAGPPVAVGGPGDLAGIEPGDVITEVDGRPIDSSDELIVKVRAHRPGDRLELTVVRDGKPRAMSLVLGSAGG